MITRCFVDVETTGKDPQRNGIIQIAGIIYNEERDIQFDYRCKPFPSDSIEQEALDVNGTTLFDIETYTDPQEIHNELRGLFKTFVSPYDKLDKMFLYGYNVKFDDNFLRAWWKKNDDNYYGSWFWTPPHCVMMLAAEYLTKVRHGMPNFKQGTVASTLGIEYDEEGLHSAINDVRITIEIYKKIVGEKII